MPIELLKYQYRKLFKLNSYDLQREPVDELFTNLRIYALIQEKQEMDLKHGAKPS